MTRPEPPTTRIRVARPRRPRAAVAGRVVALVLSVVTLAVTGYGWSIYRGLSGGTTSAALDPVQHLDGATDILLVGLDSRTDAQGNPLPQSVLNSLNAGPDSGTLNTDTIILVRVPNDPSAKATAISIPRDSYVDIPGGYGTHKINSAYQRAVSDATTTLAAQGVTGAALTKQADEAGRRLLIQTVQQLTGASIDHYAEVNLAGFADITAAVGGVQVCLTAPVQDSYSGANFPAGPQLLQGPQALAFVRQRHGLPRGDLDRIVRQQAFMASLAHQLLSAGTLTDPTTLNKLIAAVNRYIVIDNGWDVLGFASQASGLSGGNIGFQTIPTGDPALQTPEDGLAVQVDPAQVQAFVSALTASSSATPTPAPAPVAPVTVDVSNGTGRAGLAAEVEQLLVADGSQPGTTGNASRTSTSSVRANSADAPQAKAIATTLGGLSVVTDPSVAAGHVQVVLGSDYQGPTTGGQAATTTPAPTTAPAPAITAAGVPCVN